MISLCPSSMRCQLFALNDCSNRSAPLNKMATRAKNRKTFKRLLLLNQKMDFEIIIQECSWVTLYQNCLNDSATWNKMAARAINRNKLLKHSSAKSV